MTITRKELYGIIVVVLLVFIGGCAYVSSRLAVAKADQVKQDMKPIHEEAAQQKESAVKAEDGNQKALLATLAAIAAQKQQPVANQVDYDRIAAMIEERMGVHAVVKPDPALPNAPSATMPAKELRDYMLDCDASKASLTSCRSTVENVTNQLVAETTDHAATKKELVASRTAMKGGSFWTRVKSNGKWLAIGVAAGGAVVCGTGHCK